MGKEGIGFGTDRGLNGIGLGLLVIPFCFEVRTLYPGLPMW